MTFLKFFISEPSFSPNFQREIPNAPLPKQFAPLPKQRGPLPKQPSPFPKQPAPFLKQRAPLPKQSAPKPKLFAPLVSRNFPSSILVVNLLNQLLIPFSNYFPFQF